MYARARAPVRISSSMPTRLAKRARRSARSARGRRLSRDGRRGGRGQAMPAEPLLGAAELIDESAEGCRGRHSRCGSAAAKQSAAADRSGEAGVSSRLGV